MIQFNKDLEAGKITNNKNIAGVRINGLLQADWSENFQVICSSWDNYDPTFFDNYCANFYWCLRLYDFECEPYLALGLTQFQYKWLIGLLAGIPGLIAWIMAGITLIPGGVCMYVYDTNVTTCSFGLIKDDDHDYYINTPDIPTAEEYVADTTLQEAMLISDQYTN